MGESLTETKTILLDALNTLDQSFDEKLKDFTERIQTSRNILVQNENKIWLRTKKGKELLMNFNDAAQKLYDAIKIDNDCEEIEKVVTNVENITKTLEEEIRKRSMVVT